MTSDRWWPQTLWLKPGGWGRHRSVRLVSASWYQSVQAFVKLKLLPDLKQMSYNASLSMQKDSSEFSTSWMYHVTWWILIENSHGIISTKPGARRALHCMVPPQYLTPGFQMWKQCQSYFVSILTDLGVLTSLPPNKQMHAAPPLQNVNWFLVWGKVLCYENNLKSKDLVLCVAKKSTKQEQIGGNWSATQFPYSYTVYSSSALEIPLVKELHWRCSWCGLGTPHGSEKA